MARIALVVPCHEDGALVLEALHSVREPEPVEVVVVDDGSTDAATHEALEQARASGARVVRREQGGAAAARSAGLEASSAPLVFPLDADDLLEPGSLAALADALERHPDSGFAWGDYAVFGDYEGTYRTPDRVLPWTLTYLNPYPVSSLFRRAALEAAGGWRWRGRIGYEDWSLWLRLVELGIGGLRVDRVVYRRRLHGSARVQGRARGDHRALYEQLSQTHADTFRRRAELRRGERPPLWKRLAYPVAFGPRALIPPAVERFLKRAILRRGIPLAR
jgi:glycosyltransferase involved in cell wall biosynthesis